MSDGKRAKWFAVKVEYDHGSVLPSDVQEAIENLAGDVLATVVVVGEQTAERLVALENPCGDMLTEAEKAAGERLKRARQHKFSCDVTLYGPEARCNCGAQRRESG